MSEVPSPQDVEDFKAKGRMVALLCHEHYLALKGAGFTDEEAFELAENYHWALLSGQGQEYE